MDILKKQEIIDSYVSGKCMYLAAAIHRETGWEIQATITGFPDSYIGHCWCIEPISGHCVDIDGAYAMCKNGWVGEHDEVKVGLSEADLLSLVRQTCHREFADKDWELDVLEAKHVVDTFTPVADIIKSQRIPANYNTQKKAALKNSDIGKYLFPGALEGDWSLYASEITEYFEVNRKEFLYGQKRDNCGVIAGGFYFFMKSKGFELTRIGGDFVVDKGVFTKLDFFKEELIEMEKNRSKSQYFRE
jgi:hypothetical protein